MTTGDHMVAIEIVGIALLLLVAAAGLVFAARAIPSARQWVLGGVAGILGLVGLFIAARSGVGSPVGYYGGLLLFAIGLLIALLMVKLALDAAERRELGPVAAAIEPSSIRPDVEVSTTTRNLVALAIVLVAVGTVAFHLFSPWWWTPIASNWGYVDDTIIVTFWITGVVFIAIVLFVAYCVFRFRHRRGMRAAYEPENRKLEWWLTGLTTVGVAGMLTPGLFVWDQFVTVPEDAAEFEVMAQQWQFAFRFPGEDGVLGTSEARNIGPDNTFGLNPNDAHGHDDVLVEGGELRLPLGQPVKVLLRSVDVLHDFYVPEFRAKMDMVPGMITYFWFTPTRTGTFDVLCFELCGVGHYAMRATVVVEERSAHRAWLTQQPTFAQLAARAGTGTGVPPASILTEAKAGATAEDVAR